MDGLLENEYFEWLCAKVINPRQASPEDKRLLRKLHRTEFLDDRIIGDDNRAQDGKELRREFLYYSPDIPDNEEWRLVPPCSVLEMMVAFSRRAEYVTEEPAPQWFWEFVDNMRLKNKDDAEFGQAMEQFVWRMYDPSGFGGMFPLRRPRSDQREVEIWYQFCDYLVDQDRMP